MRKRRTRYEKECEKEIIRTVQKIQGCETLRKILVVAQTHLQIQNGEV